MPLDTSIVSRIGQGVQPVRSPAEVYGRILGIQNQRQEQELNQQQLESNRLIMERNARAEEAKAAQLKLDADEDAAIQRSIIESDGDLSKAWDGIYKTVRPSKALDFRKSLDESRKAAAAIAKDEVPVLEYKNGLKASVIQEAMQMPPEQYVQRWPEIAAAYNQLDPESGVDPSQPIEQGKLPFHLARVMAQTGILKERADREGLRKAVADADKAAADATVAKSTVDTRITEQANQAAAGTPDPVTGIAPNQATADMKERQAAIGIGETTDGMEAWLTKRANDRKPTTNITTNVNSREQFKDESQLRGEFDGLPIVKAYNEIKTQAQRAKGAYDLAKQAEKDGKSANSSDQVIITILNKVLDPESVVRESEYARTSEGQAALSRLSGWLDKMKRGGAGISAGERASIMETIESLSGATEREYRPIEQRYRGLAGEYGLKPDRVVLSGSSASVPTITDEAGYNKLKSGDKFIWNGREGTKP
jgi:hypothetical protein